MSLAPDRISIKRRREDEPVETLYLEHGARPDQKRRITDFYFKRVRDHVIAPISTQPRNTLPAKTTTSTSSGIPTVRWTSPGDDIRDYAKLKASIKSSTKTQEQENSKTTSSHVPLPQSRVQSQKPPISEPDNRIQPRRFHLARHLSSSSSPPKAGAHRKQNTALRPPIATFVERQTTASHTKDVSTPVDRILRVSQDSAQAPDGTSKSQEPSLDVLQSSKRTALNTFVTARKPSGRTGTSIRDHPDTWDYNSDQLADELAALAMELDPETAALQPVVQNPEPESVHIKPVNSDRMVLDGDDDYVFETYIRVPYDDDIITGDSANAVEVNVGVLVIDAEDEDLWSKYVDSDQEDDWDEEDSNAEDNPSNDYPEDEVSSDDEYGYNPYHKYRDHPSDHEYEDIATNSW